MKQKILKNIIHRSGPAMAASLILIGSLLPISGAPGAILSTSLLTPSALASPGFSPSREESPDPLRSPSTSPTPWFWVGVAGGVLIIPGFLAWRWIRHGKFFVMQPQEIALQHLDEAWHSINPERARENCSLVSGIIRRFIEDRFQFLAPQATVEEFLEAALTLNGLLSETQREQLSSLMQCLDRAKAENWNCCRPDLEAIHHSAEQFILQAAEPNCRFRRDPEFTSSDESDSSTPSLARVAGKA